MSNEGKGTGNIDNDLIKMLETTKEYKAWQESLFAIIGYASSEEIDDENIITELLADHLDASFGLQKGLENARYKTSKELHDEWLLDNCGQ